MNPKDVNPSNFKVKNILFDNGDFAVAYGKWKDESYSLAMRWNGQGNDIGYPKSRNYPMWFIIHDSMKIPIVKTLIGIPNSNFQSIIETLKTEI